MEAAQQVQLLVRPKMVHGFAQLDRIMRKLNRLASRRRLYDHELYEAAWLMSELTIRCYDEGTADEDGRSAVFPILVEEVREDLDRVAERLGEFRTGGTTQLIQSEIEATLTDLLDALRKTIEDREGGT